MYAETSIDSACKRYMHKRLQNRGITCFKCGNEYLKEYNEVLRSRGYIKPIFHLIYFTYISFFAVVSCEIVSIHEHVEMTTLCIAIRES